MAHPRLSVTDACADAGARLHWMRDVGLLVGSGALLYAALCALPTDQVKRLADEHGGVEMVTVALLAVATALAALATRRGRWQGGTVAAVILTAAVARELDFHHRFTTESITRGLGLKFLLSAHVSWVERAVVVPLVALLALTIVLFVRREWDGARRGLRARSYPVLLAVVAGALVLVAMAVDEGYGTVRRLGPELAARWQLLEELLELGASALLVLALAAVHAGPHPGRPGAARADVAPSPRRPH